METSAADDEDDGEDEDDEGEEDGTSGLSSKLEPDAKRTRVA